MSIANEADRERLSRAPGIRLGFAILAFAAVTVVTYPIARYRIFTGFTHYDDEGYMLISLKSFLDHGWLYDGVSGYGPFHYEFWGAVFSIFGLPVNHDDGRAMTMVVWVVSSLLIGLSTWRLTGSILLGLATQLSAFEALYSLVPEPMHPGGIIVLLLSTVLVTCCFVRDRISPFPMALLGGAVMALTLVKINVGIFALAALVLICVISYPALNRHRWLRPAVEAGFVALPLLLTSKTGGPSFGYSIHFGLHVSAAALAVVIALRARRVGHRDSKELWWLGGGVLALGIAVSLAILAAGASPSRLIDGVILLPLHFRSAAYTPLPPLALPNWTYVADLLALVGALGYWYLTRHREAAPSRTWTWLVSVLSILVGLFLAFGWLSLITPFMPPMTLYRSCFFRWYLLAFGWVGLIQPPGKPDERTRFARLLLPPLAVLQALHAFPVAGSQMFWSTLLLIPVGALCIANGVRWMPFSRAGHSARRTPLVIGAIAATAALVVLVSVHLKKEFNQVRAAYGGSVSLGLPGAKNVRVSPQEAANLQGIVTAIDQNCKSFVMLPRMNSFYLWTQQQPPTGYDPTGWSTVWYEARQQQVIDAIATIDRLCLLENVPLAQGWNAGSAIPPGGLLERYLHQGFAPIAKFGDYQLLQREGNRSRS